MRQVIRSLVVVGVFFGMVVSALPVQAAEATPSAVQLVANLRGNGQLNIDPAVMQVLQQAAEAGEIPPEALVCEVDESSPDVYFVAETCHNIRGDFFYDYRSFGLDLGDEGISFREAVMLTGYPLTRSFSLGGMWVQVFERAILEYHPKNAGTPFVILRRHLGRQAYDANKDSWPAEAVNPAQPKRGCQFFPETAHNLCGELLTWWESNGGLMAHGYPLTEEFTQKDGRLVVYTERQRIEWHPENSYPWDNLLGRLGAEDLERRLNPPVPGCGENAEPVEIVEFSPEPNKLWSLSTTGPTILEFWSNTAPGLGLTFVWSEEGIKGQQLKGGGKAYIYTPECRGQARAEWEAKEPHYEWQWFVDEGWVFDPSDIDCSAPQGSSHDPSPDKDVWWELPGGDKVIRVVQFWTNRPNQSQKLVKFIMLPGQNQALGGGGHVDVFPAECLATAEQWLTDSLGRLSSLDELRQRGLVRE